MVTIEELTERHQNICKEALLLACKRGDEYARREDTLQTFKAAAEFGGVTPEQVANVMIAVKVSRLLNGQFKMDTIYDLINYLIYKAVLHIEGIEEV